MRSSPWQSYSKVATQTASPGQLVLMLYDGALRFLDRAMTGFQLEDPLEINRTINNNVLKAQAIIEELNARLNMEQGGEVSANFRRLYDYLHRRLHEGNIRKEKAPLEEVISRLRVLRDSWAEMLQQGQANPGAVPPTLENLQAA